MNNSQFELGASLYVPATQSPDALVAIGNGEKYPFLRSIIYCTEDAVSANQLAEAMYNLSRALPRLNDEKRPMRFIRVRNPHVLGTLLETRAIEKVDGFVLPKLTCVNLLDYANQLSDQSPFFLMPTLETREVFDYREMNRLRRMLEKDSRLSERILCLRIGGNDLLQCLGSRRNPERSIYDSPIGCLISRLAGEFIPYGFGLTAPVFESMQHPHVLASEVERDLDNGLFGKTAIHPDQVAVIEAAFRVSPADLDEARRILAPDAPAVFRMNGRMCEPATHSAWAEKILHRERIYGEKKSEDLV
jgi:citrate lyase beta subunit